MKAIIMAGGSGTRLWPLSRGKYPKQFLKLKEFEKSLFQMTVERCIKFCELSDIYVLTLKDYEFIVRLQLEELNYQVGGVNILIEPQPKNTLPAIYNAVQAINHVGAQNDVVVVMTSDHLIRESGKLVEQIISGAELATEYIFTFGIKPSAPETGFGYIAAGDRLGVGYKISRFREKPDLETAKKYVSEGYFWNSGMFMFGTELFRNEVKKYSPDVYNAFELPTMEERFKEAPSISIDYGVMEKSDHTAVLPLNVEFDIGWDDLGSFATFYGTFTHKKDKNGNIGFEDEIFVDTHNTLVYSQKGKQYALIGVNDLIVVDQGDALLVADKEHTQSVKNVVDELKKRADKRAEMHLTEYHPWGSCVLLENGEFYKIKRLDVLQGKQLSYQKHYHRSEHWIVVKGTATVILDGVEHNIRSNENIFIQSGVKHLLRNDGRIILEVIEVQSGQYLGDDDIVRYEEEFELV